jgi:hypothetical protein
MQAANATLPSKYEDQFGITFGATFCLTLIAVPLLLSGDGQEQIHGGAFVVFLIGGLAIAAMTVLKSVIVAALVFFPTYKIVTLFLARRLTYVLCSAVSAFFSASVALVINIDFFPLGLTLDGNLWTFSSWVGVVAMLIAVFVSSMQMATGK